jgi:hypothetical protein
MSRLILVVIATRMDGAKQAEDAPGARNRDAGETRPGRIIRDAEKSHILVAIRKCFLLLNERVTAISIRDRVAIRLSAGEGENRSIKRRRVVSLQCMCLN